MLPCSFAAWHKQMAPSARGLPRERVGEREVPLSEVLGLGTFLSLSQLR